MFARSRAAALAEKLKCPSIQDCAEGLPLKRTGIYGEETAEIKLPNSAY